MSRAKSKKTFDEEVGERLREKRLSCDTKVTQSDAAIHIHRSEGQMSRYESGAHPAPSEVLHKLAALYKCKVEDFMPETKNG